MPVKNVSGYYNVEHYNRQKKSDEDKNGINIPPEANVIAAANHLRALLDGKKFEYGLFGGLAMLCLGSRRKQVDVHIAYDDKDFLRLRMKLENDQRVRLPEGMNSLFPAKILVRTGSVYKDEGCTTNGDIEVNLVPPGSHGTPFSGTIHNNLVLLTLRTSGKPKPFKGLNILHLLRTSISYCNEKDVLWEPRHDVVFLCQNYGHDVQAMRNKLDQKALKQNFLGDPYFERLSPQDQVMCYQVLLGTAPPPRMAIRPPSKLNSHKPAASASSIDTRPTIAPHQSIPAVKADATSALLSPPLPGKARPHQRAASAEVRPSKLPASNVAESHGLDSRSRYRPISAPGSREASPNGIPTPSQHNLHSTPPVPVDMRCAQDTAYHPQRPHSYLAPMPNITQSRRSMPNLKAGSHAPLPLYAFTHTPSLNTATTNFIQPIEMSATPVTMNPGQHHLKSQYGLTEAVLPVQTRNHPITEKPMPLQARASYQDLPVFRAELSATPMLRSHMNYASPGTAKDGNKSHAAGLMMDPSKDASHAGAVELDAATPIGQYTAELSVERATPTPGHERTQQFPVSPPETHTSLDPVSHNGSPFVPHDSPVSPPQYYVDSAVPIQPIESALRPMNPRTQSAPAHAPALRSSLTAGSADLSAHAHGLPSSLAIGSPPKPSIPHSSNAQAIPDATPLKTNASRYTRYYASPPSQSTQLISTYQAYNPLASMSAPVDTHEIAESSRPLSFAHLKDVDGAGHYFASHGHKRDKSHDSHASSTSHDSRELADEYRATLGSFDGGYGGDERL